MLRLLPVIPTEPDMALTGRVLSAGCLSRSLRALITAHLGADPVVADVPFPDTMMAWLNPSVSYGTLIGSSRPALADDLQIKSLMGMLLDKKAHMATPSGTALGALLLALGAPETEDFTDQLRTAVSRPLSYTRHYVGAGNRGADGNINGEVILSRSASLIDALPWERDDSGNYSLTRSGGSGNTFARCALPSIVNRWALTPTWPEQQIAVPGDPYSNMGAVGARKRAIIIRLNLLWLTLQPGLLTLRQLIRFCMEDEFLHRLRVRFGASVIDDIVDDVLKPVLEMRVHPWVAEVERLHGWRSVHSAWGERQGRRLTTRFWAEGADTNPVSDPRVGQSVDLLSRVVSLAMEQDSPCLTNARYLLELSRAPWIESALSEGARVFGWVTAKEAAAGAWSAALHDQSDWITTDGRYTADPPPPTAPELFWRPATRNSSHFVRRMEYHYEAAAVTASELTVIPAESRRPYPPDYETYLRVPATLPETARGLTGIPSVSQTLRTIAAAQELQGDVDLEPFSLTFRRIMMITGIDEAILRSVWVAGPGDPVLHLELRRLIPALADGSPDETTSGFKSARTRLPGFDLAHSALADVPWKTYLMADGAFLAVGIRVDAGEGHADLARLTSPLDGVWATSSKIGL